MAGCCLARFLERLASSLKSVPLLIYAMPFAIIMPKISFFYKISNILTYIGLTVTANIPTPAFAAFPCKGCWTRPQTPAVTNFSCDKRQRNKFNVIPIKMQQKNVKKC